MTYKVIDNFLSEEDYLKIKYEMIDSRNFPWFYYSTVSLEGFEDETFYFNHIFFGNPYYKSHLLELVNPIIDKIKPKSLIRVKGNLYTNMGKWMENGKHMDYDFEHKGAIYYVNTNNGYTVLEDGTKIESIANRILFFDSSKPHNSTHCTDQKVRVNININYF
jgi:hypothetical protein